MPAPLLLDCFPPPPLPLGWADCAAVATAGDLSPEEGKDSLPPFPSMPRGIFLPFPTTSVWVGKGHSYPMPARLHENYTHGLWLQWVGTFPLPMPATEPAEITQGEQAGRRNVLFFQFPSPPLLWSQAQPSPHAVKLEQAGAPFTPGQGRQWQRQAGWGRGWGRRNGGGQEDIPLSTEGKVGVEFLLSLGLKSPAVAPLAWSEIGGVAAPLHCYLTPQPLMLPMHKIQTLRYLEWLCTTW